MVEVNHNYVVSGVQTDDLVVSANTAMQIFREF